MNKTIVTLVFPFLFCFLLLLKREEWNKVLYIKYCIPLLAAIETIVTSCWIYKKQEEKAEKDNYINNNCIATLFHSIDNDGTNLRILMTKDKNSSNNRIQLSIINKTPYIRKIKTDCSLLGYYIRRHPGFYKQRNILILILYGITKVPTNFAYYDRLSEGIEHFYESIKKTTTLFLMILITKDTEQKNTNYYKKIWKQ